MRTGRRHGVWYSEADVDGHAIWFESPDAELSDSPEAHACAMLLPAARARRRVHVAERAVSKVWQSNNEPLMTVWHEWWGYPVLVPEAATRSSTGVPAQGTALCFTGGIDSFHTLLRGERAPDLLAFVQGYDISLDDDRRMEAWRASLDEIAAVAGVRPVGLRSNIRQHPLVAASQWTRAHGGALAAVGHLVVPMAGTLLVASSFPPRYGYAWGSHARTDHLWSSDRLTVVHDGAERSRVDKVADLAAEPLVHRHLRVCWENRAPTGNCSRCDKCLCTMATIVACGGDPSSFRTFDWSRPIEQLLDRRWSTRFVLTYGELLQRDLPPALEMAIRRLLTRNALPARAQALWEWWRG